MYYLSTTVIFQLAASISDGDSTESHLQDESFLILQRLALAHGGIADEQIDQGTAIVQLVLPLETSRLRESLELCV